MGSGLLELCLFVSLTIKYIFCLIISIPLQLNMHFAYLFVLKFYGPVNPTGSCRAQSVYIITRLLGRRSRLSG